MHPSDRPTPKPSDKPVGVVGVAIYLYNGNDCNGEVYQIQNYIINKCTTTFNIYNGAPSGYSMLTLSNGFNVDSLVDITAWAYDPVAKCVGPPVTPAKPFDTMGAMPTAINTCVSFPYTIYTPQHYGGFTQYTGFRSQKMVTSASMAPISNTNLDPQLIHGMSTLAFYDSKDCSKTTGTVQMTLQLPIGICSVDVSQKYLYAGITSNRTTCNTDGAVSMISYARNMNCGAHDGK